MKQIKAIPCMAALLQGADYADVKTAEGTVSLETFIHNMLTRRPAWLRGLYAVRGVIAKVLGLRHDEHLHRQQASTFNLAPGGDVSFFSSVEYETGKHWLGMVQDTHLDAWLGVVREPLEGETDQARFHVLTVVKHKRWTGPVYLTLIKPMHHLVVSRMMRAGLKD